MSLNLRNRLYRFREFLRRGGVGFSSSDYWESRYRRGGTSGGGSYGDLATYKAGFINDFIERHAIASVIEFGCGDGNQAAMLKVPAYVGIDISSTALELCRKRIGDRPGWRFANVGETASYAGRYDLALSLDVIYHLVEDEVFETYMHALLDHAAAHVLVYSSDFDEIGASHVLHRKYSAWIASRRPEWRLKETFHNPFSVSEPDCGTAATPRPRTQARFAHFVRTEQ